MTTTEHRGHIETAQQGGTGSRQGIVECMGTRRKGVVDTAVDATVDGTEMETITVMTTGWTVEEHIMIGALGTMRGQAPGSEGRQKGKEGQSISCRKLGEGSTKLTRSR